MSPHVGSVEALFVRLAASPDAGLTKEEARVRLERDGENVLPEAARPSALRHFFAQLANPIVGTLLVAGLIAFVNGAENTTEPFLARWGDAISIVLIVALNAVLGFVQERRAGAALDALEKMQSSSARVRRDGRTAVVDAREVVVGDIIEVEAGDAIPADARLVQSIDLAAFEAALTGESVPVAKDARAELAADAPLGDRATMLFVGTSVARGKASALVVATGLATELGRVSALMSSREPSKTPLEERLAAFGKRILWLCIVLSGALFGWGLYVAKETWQQVLLGAVSLAVAAIPEGLPAITTLTLALGMQRMATRGAIVRKLAAVETLGSATVICTDKTGTLTRNEMTVSEVYCAGRSYQVTGVGYAASGEIVGPDGASANPRTGPLTSLLESVVLANTAKLEEAGTGEITVIGDPTEAALLTLAEKAGVTRSSLSLLHDLVHEIPFDSDRKRMTVVTLDSSGREIVHTKGSCDVMLPLCVHLHTEEGVRVLDADGRAVIQAEADRMSAGALRVLAVARRELGPEKLADAAEGGAALAVEERLTFLGLVGMIDPPRDGVKDAIRECADAGIRVVMVTGDHKLTAVAIARALGMWEPGAVALTGSEVEALDDAELAACIDDARVFARVTAEQKLRIVRAFKARGHVVAMTGDGVNDAPALREAHIGIAMGKNGTDVARSAADLVLADDDFATIVHAVREGRAIWRNIQKSIFFLLSSNAGLVVAVFTASMVPSLPPLRPIMILWINLVTNGLPALALGIDPPGRSQMREPPHRTSDGLLGWHEYVAVAVVGVAMGGAAVGFLFFPWSVAPGISGPLYGRALAFSVLALSPLFHAFSCRSTTRSIVSASRWSRPLLAAVGVSALIHAIAVVVPALRGVFHTYAMPAVHWLVLLGVSASIVPVMELWKVVRRRLGAPDHAGPRH